MSFFDDDDMIYFVAELTITYLLCGMRDGNAVRSKLNDGKSVFKHLLPGPSAFAYVTLLNNHKLWTLRCENLHDRDHVCHGTKGGIYTRKAASGGGGRWSFKCGWDKDGVQIHNKLMAFFSKMRQHTRFVDLETACDIWWEEQQSNRKMKRANKRQRDDVEEEDDGPTFLEFTQMMGV